MYPACEEPISPNSTTGVADGEQSTGATAAFDDGVRITSDENTNSLAATAKGAGATATLGDFSVDSFILALQNVATLRAENGAISSRLQFAGEQLEAAKVNMEAARSRIVDTDVAQESTRFARYSILTQAGAAMLSQANNSQSSIIQMLML